MRVFEKDIIRQEGMHEFQKVTMDVMHEFHKVTMDITRQDGDKRVAKVIKYIIRTSEGDAVVSEGNY
jgi:hypothetical protein